MGGHHIVLHVANSRRTERITVAKWTDVSVRWTTFVLGMLLRLSATIDEC